MLLQFDTRHSARVAHFLRMSCEIFIDTEENVSKDFVKRQVTKLIKQVDNIASDISNDMHLYLVMCTIIFPRYIKIFHFCHTIEAAS